MPTPTPSSPAADPRGRRWFAGAAALGGIGIIATAAQAQGMAPGMGRPWGGHGALDPEEMARRLDYRIGRLIKDIGGTPEQKDKLVAIAKSAMADMKPLREQHMAARHKGMELLAAATIDKPALEQLRVSQVQAADAMSQRVLKSLIDAAEVLSPEQRTRVAEHLKGRMARRNSQR